jgi:hypothetical protein
VRTGVEVLAIEPGRGVRVRSATRPGEAGPPGGGADAGLLRAASIVLAAGPWSAPLAASAGLHLPLEPRKGQLTRLRLPRPDPRFLERKVVDGSYLLAVGSADPGRQVSTVVETTWDGHVVVGSTRERCGFDPAVDHDLARAVQERAARLVPGRRGARRRRDMGRLPARGCPITCPRSAPRAWPTACGWRPATRARASCSARSAAGCWHRR